MRELVFVKNTAIVIKYMSEMGGMCSMHGKKKESCKVVETKYKTEGK